MPLKTKITNETSSEAEKNGKSKKSATTSMFENNKIIHNEQQQKHQ